MCTNPIRVSRQYKDTSIEACVKRMEQGKSAQFYYGFVPCGKCYECLSSRRSGWTVRLKNEAQNSRKTIFVTFTYSDENCDGELHKNHIKKAVKYMRDHHYLQFKYYMIGEYGTQTHRPHYHALFFLQHDYALTTLDDALHKAWSIKENKGGHYCYTPYGNISWSEAIPQRIGYITHYHTRPKEIAGKTNRSFACMSQGLGLHLLTAKVLKHLEQSPDYYVRTIDGDKFLLPSYYRKKFNIDKNIISAKKHWLIKDRDELEYYLSLDTNQQLRYRESKKEASRYKLKMYNNQVKLNTI